MKYDQLKAFEKHLEGSFPHHFSNLYMILAKDEGERKIAVEKLLNFLLADSKDRSLSLVNFDGEKLDLESVFSELNTNSLFGGKRVILVHNGDKLQKKQMEAFQHYFAHPSRKHYLAISAASINRNTNFYKQAEKAGVIFDQGEEKPWEKEKRLVEWIFGRVAENKKQISPQVCQCLIKQIGTDQILLEQELQKLFCFASDRQEITLQDLSAVCVSVNIESVWQLGDALFRKDAKTSLKIMKDQLDDGVVLLTLLRQIRSQFQTEFHVCSILSSGGNSQDIAAEFPYMKGAILDKHIQTAGRFGMDSFKKAILAIDETELMAKNSIADASYLAERLIISLTT